MPARHRLHSPEPETKSLSRDFAQSSIVVERDLETAKMVHEDRDGYKWIVAYPSYDTLVAVRGRDRDLGEFEGIDHLTMTGRALREQARKQGFGVVFRANRDDEDIVMSWPPQAVSRVAVVSQGTVQ